MDYEQINPNLNPTQPPKPSRSPWKWVIILLILVAAAVGWYFYRAFFAPAPELYPPTAETQPETQPSSGEISSGDTTSQIAEDLEQTPDESVLNDELNSLDKDLQNF